MLNLNTVRGIAQYAAKICEGANSALRYAGLDALDAAVSQSLPTHLVVNHPQEGQNPSILHARAPGDVCGQKIDVLVHLKYLEGGTEHPDWADAACTCNAESTSGNLPICKHTAAALLWRLPEAERSTLVDELTELRHDLRRSAQSSEVLATAQVDLCVPPRTSDAGAGAAPPKNKSKRKLPSTFIQAEGDNRKQQNTRNQPRVDSPAPKQMRKPSTKAAVQQRKPALMLGQTKRWLTGEEMLALTDQEIVRQCREALEGLEEIAATVGETLWSGMATGPATTSAGKPVKNVGKRVDANGEGRFVQISSGKSPRIDDVGPAELRTGPGVTDALHGGPLAAPVPNTSGAATSFPPGTLNTAIKPAFSLLDLFDKL
jgi:hypothetical protein